MTSLVSPVATASLAIESNIDGFLECASHAADVASEICRRHFGNTISITYKEDGSPVTDADVEIERKIREVIQKSYSHHSIFGEELGMTHGNGEGRRFTWVIDPIDGTSSFITGNPCFCILIALLYDGVPILGVIDQPIVRDRWTGAIQRQTCRNGVPVTTRDCGGLSFAYMYSYSYSVFHGDRQVVYDRISPRVREHIWGGDSYAYGLLASGFVDIVCDANMQVYDYMALVPVIEGAGGLMTDWCGNRLSWKAEEHDTDESIYESTLAAATPELHKEAIKTMNWQK